VRFRSSVLVSGGLHLALGGILLAFMGGHIPWREEMVVDLTGSFRTRTPAALADSGREGRAADNRRAGRQVSAARVPGLPDGEEAGDIDSTAPLYDVTSLPELRDVESLKEKLGRYYPPEARRQGEEGVVLLEVVVSSRGQITDARVVRTDQAAFSEAALKVCRELIFAPAYIGSRAVAVRIRLPIRFELDR